MHIHIYVEQQQPKLIRIRARDDTHVYNIDT